MARYFINLAYNGSAYHGWQVQPNQVSVQEVLTESLKRILRHDIELVGAGRTDSGVHASLMVAHFDTDVSFDSNLLVKNLNSLLPNDIVIYSINAVSEEMHARFSAKSRTYNYFISFEKNPFKNGLQAMIYGSLDFELMNCAASKLLDYNDFTSFSKLHTDTKTNNCKISEAYWHRLSEKEWCFTITADRFLRNMVRAIVGTLFEVGRHKLTVEEFCKIIEKKDRCSAGTSAPAQGLFLSDIKY